MLNGWSDTIAPVITLSNSPFGGKTGPFVRAGDVVSLTVSVSGTDCAPAVRLFGGTRAAATLSQTSPFVFSYQIQAGDTGAISYAITVQDEAGNTASAAAEDMSRTAGKVCRWLA
mgnify:CR=1 FL=1